MVHRHTIIPGMCIKNLFFLCALGIFLCPPSVFARLQANPTDTSQATSVSINEVKEGLSAEGDVAVGKKEDQLSAEGAAAPAATGIAENKASDNAVKSEKLEAQPVGSFEDKGIGTLLKENKKGADGETSSGQAGKPSPLRSLASLAGVIGLMLLLGWLFRRFVLGGKGGNGHSVIEVLARSPVTSKQTLCLVKLDRRLLLVGLSPNHMASLFSFEEPDEIARIMGLLEKQSPHSISNAFDRFFNHEVQDYDDTQEGMEGDMINGDAGGETNVDINSVRWNTAQNELGSLLSKVKGLSRMRLKI